MPPAPVLTPAVEGGLVAYDPETGTTTQGDSVTEAISNLREATELYLEELVLYYTNPLTFAAPFPGIPKIHRKEFGEDSAQMRTLG